MLPVLKFIPYGHVQITINNSWLLYWNDNLLTNHGGQYLLSLACFQRNSNSVNVHSIHLMDYILCEKQVMMFWIQKLTHFSLEIKSARLNSLSDLSWHQVKQITKISQVLLIFPLQICSRNPNPFINIFWLHLICLKTLLFLQGF